MSYRTDVAYAYDGSFEGFLCCVFESYEKRELPFDIYSELSEEGFLFDARPIVTDPEKADRVLSSIPVRISHEAQEMVRLGWLTCSTQKELLLLRFLRLGFARGAAVTDMLADDTVHALGRAVRHLQMEAHRLTGFIRFSLRGGVLVSVIEPQNSVLPLIEEHFCDRFRNESFIIYDQPHRLALIHEPGRHGILPLEELTLNEADTEEEEYVRLWKRFYDTIAIEGRRNPRLRMSHMPKRYWNRLPEMQDELTYSTNRKDRRAFKAAESPGLSYGSANSAPKQLSEKPAGPPVLPQTEQNKQAKITEQNGQTE